MSRNRADRRARPNSMPCSSGVDVCHCWVGQTGVAPPCACTAWPESDAESTSMRALLPKRRIVCFAWALRRLMAGAIFRDPWSECQSPRRSAAITISSAYLCYRRKCDLIIMGAPLFAGDIATPLAARLKGVTPCRYLGIDLIWDKSAAFRKTLGEIVYKSDAIRSTSRKTTNSRSSPNIRRKNSTSH